MTDRDDCAGARLRGDKDDEWTSRCKDEGGGIAGVD